MIMSVARADILKLYKNSLLYVNSLKYTDKDWLRPRFKEEFKRPVGEDKLDHCYKKGLAFVERSRLA